LINCFIKKFLNNRLPQSNLTPAITRRATNDIQGTPEMKDEKQAISASV
jgi:hypothetical protein